MDIPGVKPAKEAAWAPGACVVAGAADVDMAGVAPSALAATGSGSSADDPSERLFLLLPALCSRRPRSCGTCAPRSAMTSVSFSTGGR